MARRKTQSLWCPHPLPDAAGASHFQAYTLEQNDGHKLKLSVRLSTDSAGIARCLGLQGEAKVELDAILARIEQKVTAETLFSIGEAPPPIRVVPEE